MIPVAAAMLSSSAISADGSIFSGMFGASASKRQTDFLR